MLTSPPRLEGSSLRIEAQGLIGGAGVAIAGALFAHAFTASGGLVLEWWASSDDPIDAATALRHPVVVVGVVATLALAVAAGTIGRRMASGLTGLSHVAAAARGDGPGPSFRATSVRSLGTWFASFGLGSIGRESAIIEMGAAFGTAAGRHRRFAPSLAAAGITAAFTAAYHAPFAGVLYVVEHLRIRRNPRALLYTLVGAGVGHLISVTVLGTEPIFPAVTDGSRDVVILGLVVAVPTGIAIRTFYELRTRFTVDRFGSRTSVRVAFLVIAGATVAVAPGIAGNGMAGLRHASGDTVLQVALALALVKFIGTWAALGSGAPGGTLSPTIAVAAGWALLTTLALESVGFAVPGDPWSAMVMAMPVGVAVGLRSPLVAIVLIPEMLGDLSLIPAAALVVAVAVAVDRLGDHFVAPRVAGAILGVRDDDA